MTTEVRTESGRELVERIHRQALEQLRSEAPSEPEVGQETPQIDLPPAEPGSPFAEEWEAYRNEVRLLLAQGCRGRFALIRIGQPITVWDSLRDAAQAARLLYGSEPCLVQQIDSRLRPLRAG
jgi:hypothetical protein